MANGSRLTPMPAVHRPILTFHGVNPYPVHLPLQWAGLRLRPVARPTPLNPNRYPPSRKAQERKVLERKVLERRRPPGLQVPRWLHVPKMGAELEESEVWAVQGKRIRVLHVATLPKLES
jgi:hypothetical protein